MSALAVLRPDSLTLAYGDRPTLAGGTLPPSAVADMEVVSEADLMSVVAKLVPVNGKGSVDTILAISDELCYTLPFETKSKDNVEKMLVSLTPFNEVVTTLLPSKNQQYMVATNRDLYESVARALAVRNHNVILVLPWMNITQLGFAKNTLDSTLTRRVHENLSTLRIYGFPLTVEHAENEPSIVPGITKGRPSKFSPWWLVFLAAALVYGFVMYWFFIRQP